MEEPNSDHWLPPGWTVEVRVRKNGKRDKYYFSPSSGLKFNSKVEVFRHLGNAQNKVSVQKRSPNVMVEKGVAEGLPPGWKKVTRMTTKEDTVRRDLSVRVTMKPTSSVSIGQSSYSDMIASNQQIPRSASSGEYAMPILECVSNQGVVGTELTSSILLQAQSLNQKEVKLGLAQGTLVSGCTDKDAQEKQLQENSETKYGTEKAQAQNHKRKYKHKKEINLPRRASKRLAGIKLDPVPELVTRSRARRGAAKQSGVEETVTDVDKSSNSLSDGLARQFNAPVDGSEIKTKSEKHPERTLEVQRSNMDNECFSFLPLENNATVEECVRVLENGDNVDAKLGYTLDFPLKELLTDPCIAFAIQTLTGVTFETSINSQTSSELKNSQHSETSAVTAAASEGLGEKNNGSGDNVFSSPENFAIPQELASDAKAEEKANNENTVPSSEKTPDDMSWMDPCIEFAIKTLTGTIPIDSDQNPKNCLQQQLSSSNNQHSEMALSSVSLDNLYQTDYYCNPYFGTQKPMFQQSFVDPSSQHTRNIGIGNSTGARHCGGEDNRRNVC